ncbi:MAG TPA: PTS sugar transporter subunit IIB [Pseudogracilibacillus sp.]|nr:PTS sugar transporter subunit IIB [Pseudogracilibacillus sp.]
MKIILICSAGLSTTMLVNKMRESAEARNIPAEIKVLAESEQITDHIDGLHVVLIGPQVRFLEKKLRDSLEPEGIKVDVIDQMAYGLMQGDKVLDQAVALYEN